MQALFGAELHPKVRVGAHFPLPDPKVKDPGWDLVFHLAGHGAGGAAHAEAKVNGHGVAGHHILLSSKGLRAREVREGSLGLSAFSSRTKLTLRPAPPEMGSSLYRVWR